MSCPIDRSCIYIFFSFQKDSFRIDMTFDLNVRISPSFFPFSSYMNDPVRPSTGYYSRLQWLIPIRVRYATFLARVSGPDALPEATGPWAWRMVRE